jgi:hypothetical protein
MTFGDLPAIGRERGGDDYLVPLNMGNADPEKFAALAKLVQRPSSAVLRVRRGFRRDVQHCVV